jgi:hypothetical protein
MAPPATARRGNMRILEPTDFYHRLPEARRGHGGRPGGRAASHDRRARSLTEASNTASIRVLWSGIRGKTLAVAADIRGPRTSTTGAARNARSASTACASGRLTASSGSRLASSGGWSRSCCGDRGPDHVARPEPDVRTCWSFCDDTQNLIPHAPVFPLLISSTCGAVRVRRPRRCPAPHFARGTGACVTALPPL